MSYPNYIEASYINPSGNISASGYFKSYITQQVANAYPIWDKIRMDESSVGQEFFSPFSRILHDIRNKNRETLSEKFISLAPVDEIDVLYRMKVPSTISFLESQDIECWTAPSGCTPSGYPFPFPSGSPEEDFNAIQITQKNDLEEFYYHSLPTRIKVVSSGSYSDWMADHIGIEFSDSPLYVEEPNGKYIDQWKREHDIVWSHDGYIDQELVINPELGVSVVGAGYQNYGGIFTAQNSGDISSIYAAVATSVGASGKGQVKILTMSGGTGTVVATSETSSILPSTAGWYLFNFSTPLSVTAGTEYLITISISSSGDVRLYRYPNASKNVLRCNSPFYTIQVLTAGYESMFYSPGFFSTEIDPVSYDFYVYQGVVIPATKFLRQDALTKETYEDWLIGGSGAPKSMAFHRDKLYWVGVSDDSNYFLNISNPHPAPVVETLDTLSVFNVTSLYGPETVPSGIDIDEEGKIWIIDEDRENLFNIELMHDYYFLDKENRYIYFREDYSDPGVFVKPV